MDATAQIKDFSFCLTSDLDSVLRVKIVSVEGSKPERTIEELLGDAYARHSEVCGSRSEIYVTCQLYADNKPTTLPFRTSYHSFQTKWSINEWLVIPIRYRDLTLSSQLAFTVWDAYAPRKPVPLGGSTFRVFGKHNTLKTGKHKLFLWPWQEADGQEDTSTPSKVVSDHDMDRLEKLMRKYEAGDLQRMEWLDRLVFREIENINKMESHSRKALFLYIDLPQFDFPLVFNEKEYPVAGAKSKVEPEYRLIVDPEASADNPVENKHRKLARSHRNGPLDRDLKPNAKIRDDLNKILRYPPSQNLTTEEKDLLWKFRFYLTRDKKALTKFLKCVVWTDLVEVKQATDLLRVWADIDIDDALELLGPTFEDLKVRSYAVSQLRKADDEELQLYLLQLVQALKFENITDKSSLSDSPLAQFLIERAIKNPILGNYFHWYVMVECEDKAGGRMYAKVAYQFMTAMTEVPRESHRRDILLRQGQLIATLAKLSKDLRLSKEPRLKKIERLRTFIAEPKHGLLSFAPLPLPLDAHVQVTGLLPEKASIFKSALFPLRLTFLCSDGSEYPVIFKTGDDLRQDQLVVQIIMLMNKLLRKENLDLKLTPYKVLATGVDHGMVQFIPSLPLATILSEYSSLLTYLRENNHVDGATAGTVPSSVMDTYIRSTAGYCVITYLLGIGDRHLDNVLLTTEGNLFHIDFGFILGRDPKPFPPPMKLSREMVEAMGGASSQAYQKFKSYCFIAFNGLRKNANLILNLFSLMVNANIPDIAIEPDKAVQKVQERFRLDLSDEEAIQFFQTLINESVGAVFPQVMEKIHQVAQLLRS
ncbi:Phosphatidylinositol (PI) 3-kinase [Gaertneriomyces sp. JEL0708]|nr:Phosphatidylinositol (PI) 3-kinase [Gaertneriomyces sp. JEL0708]